MRVHLLGIGGTGMGSLAGLFVEAGHTVTGTDEAIYPPMSDQLAGLGIKPFQGYSAQNIAKANPELVVIGNVIRRENPEAQEVLRLGLPYRSMPTALSEHFLATRTPIVVTGTHGKTTSATLTSWLLTAAGEAPGFLVGGVGLNLQQSYELGKGHFFVVEGDEYDTAFFDKGPKFLHYRPQAAIITSIEFDHADIYKDVQQIESSFTRFAEIVPPDGLIAVHATDERALRVTRNARCRVITYGTDPSAKFRAENISISEQGTSFTIAGIARTWLLPRWGNYNLENTRGVLAVLIESGINVDRLAGGLVSFKGIRRRQELVGEVDGIVVLDDFAHHPTAVACTIDGVRARFPGRRLWAIFEPRSNTSRRNIFQHEFTEALMHADRVIVASPFKSEAIPEAERFDSRAVADAIMRRKIDAHHIDTVEHIVEYVMRGVDAGDVILVMSNGGFGGIHMKLIESLKRRRTA